MLFKDTKNGQAPAQDKDWRVEFEEKVACAMYPIIQQITKEETIDITNLVKSFIAEQIEKAEARGRQEGANSQDQFQKLITAHKTYVAGLAQDLLPIQNEKKHNEAVLKLSNINN